MTKLPSNKGVSPVIAIILMVAITIVLVGILSLWIFSLVDDDRGGSPVYAFDSDLDSDNDQINLTLVMGDVIDTLKMGVKINAQDVDIPDDYGNLFAGVTFTLNSPIDLEKSVEYHISVIIDNKVVWENDMIST